MEAPALRECTPYMLSAADRGKRHEIAQNTADWLVLSSKGTVRASAAGGICGVGMAKNMGPIALARYKRMPIYEEDRQTAFHGTAATEYGHCMEDLLVDCIYTPFMRSVTGDARWAVGNGGYYVREHIGDMPQDFVATASPDGYTLLPLHPEGSPEEVLLEIKAPLYRNYPDMRTPSHHGVKCEHLVQMHHQMWVTGLGQCDYLSYCYAQGTYTLARVWRSEAFLTWMKACYRIYHDYLTMPLAALVSIPVDGDIQYVPPMPSLTATVCVRSLAEVYGVENPATRFDLETLDRRTRHTLFNHTPCPSVAQNEWDRAMREIMAQKEEQDRRRGAAATDGV